MVSRSYIYPSYTVFISLNTSSLSNQTAEGLFVKSTVRHLRINEESFRVYLEGMGSQQPYITFFINPGKSFAMKGGLRAQSSQIRHPSDQISQFYLYFLPDQISGLVQQGVPVCVVANLPSMTLETFMSPSFAVPLTKNTLAALISRWTILLACRNLSPRRRSCATFQIKFSSNTSTFFAFFLIKPERSPPSAYSITMARVWPHS